MPRFFNTAGPCDPTKHYTLPPEERIPAVRGLLETESFFVVHAPRQTGKTTSFRTLARSLVDEGRFAALHATCETGATARDDVAAGVRAVIDGIRLGARFLPEELRPPVDDGITTGPESALAAFLTHWAETCPRPIVLFLDEIDALRDEALVAVLRQLRAGFSMRPDHFPSSVALIGLRDVRDYRVKIRPEEETLGTSSPFNVKVESLTLPDFTAEEVATLLAQHAEETGQGFTERAVERTFELTRGQPWLVNALARQAVETLVPDRARAVDVEVIEEAKEVLILRRDTHLDSLANRLRESRVRRVIEPILAGRLIEPDAFDDDVSFVEDLGLIHQGAEGLEIANPIYREIIPRTLTHGVQKTAPIEHGAFVRGDGSLDFAGLLEAFVDFWREHSEFYLRRQPYSEAAAQLIFMAFLQRVVNGGGFVDREYGVGRGRVDLCVRWPRESGVDRWAVELKVWRDGEPDPLKKGVEQLSAYLDRLGLDTGHLLLFDQREGAPPLPERIERGSIEHDGRTLGVLRL